MIKELNVFPHNMAACSPADRRRHPLRRHRQRRGRGAHQHPGARGAELHRARQEDAASWCGRATRPARTSCTASGRTRSTPRSTACEQVIFPGGDGWLYGFEPETGELIWKFDCNPKDAVYELGGTGTRSDFIGTPVVYDNKVYIGVGQDPEHTTGVGHFWCIDPTKKGDISDDLDTGMKDKDGKADRREAEPELGRGLALRRRREPASGRSRDFKFGRTMCTACIVDDIVYIAELPGFLHCLDAKTGKHYWEYDIKASIWGSPYYVDGKIFLGNDDGDLFIFKHEKKHEVYRRGRSGQERAGHEGGPRRSSEEVKQEGRRRST